MADVRSRGTALPAAAVGEPDALLATKVSIPRVRRDVVSRPRLLERLQERLAQELLLVCTPAGFGKSTLLAGWAHGARWPVAWLSLDADDNDPARFWRYVVAALDRVHPGIGEPVLALFTGPSRPSGEAVVTSLLNELAALPDELALVLDDYHVMESQQVHQAVAFLLDHVPPQLHVVIASRADPPLPLARLRARGQLGELRAADLRFTRQEAAVLLQDVWKLDLPAEAVVALEDRTEGWVAGLQLAALSLQGRAEVAGFIEAFTGTHRFVLDYLSEEVLARQPEQVQTFLLETSVLERVSGPLCDAVTGRADSQRLLEQIERANLFLVPLDEVRGWWRYHHLFADLLCAHLAREQPERLPELHRAAAAWFEQHGLIDEGIRHASAAGDETRAARLVEEQLGERLRRGESVTLTRWLAALPEHTLRSRPRLCLAQALLQWHRYRLDEVERLLEHVEHALDQRPGPGAPGIPTEGGLVADLSAAIALLRAQVAAVRGDPEQTAGLARAALARMTGTESGPRLWARKLLVLADWLRGRMQEAESGYRQVLTEARAAPEPHPMTTSCSALATVQRAQGRLGAALQTYWEGPCATPPSGAVPHRSTPARRIWESRRCSTSATSWTTPSSTPPRPSS